MLVEANSMINKYTQQLGTANPFNTRQSKNKDFMLSIGPVEN